MAKVRVKPWEAPVAVSHPLTGQFLVPDRSAYFADDDPLVQAHGWLFATDAQIADRDGDEQAGPARRGRRA